MDEDGRAIFHSTLVENALQLDTDNNKVLNLYKRGTEDFASCKTLKPCQGVPVT